MKIYQLELIQEQPILIAVYRNGTVEIIPNEKGDITTLSVVIFLDNYILVGEQTEYKILEDPSNKIYIIKRIIGRKEVQEDIIFLIS